MNGAITEEAKMADAIKSGDYTIGKIKRKFDGRVFNCYFRNGRVRLKRSGRTSWWISDDREELLLHGISLDEFEVLSVFAEKN